MRYAAVIQTGFDSTSRVVGVGETRDDALDGARGWFQTQFDRTSHKDWPRLIALQDQLAILDETELKWTTGSSMDDWLRRMAALGIAPSTAPPRQTTTDAEPLVPLPRRRNDEGAARALATSALLAIAIIAALTTAKYVGGRMLQQELNEIATQNTFDVGPIDPPVYAAFDPHDWGGLSYAPSFTGGGSTIVGIGP